MANKGPSKLLIVAGSVVLLFTTLGPVVVGFAVGVFTARVRGEVRQAEAYENLAAPMRADARQWAPSHTQSECLDEGMRRDGACRDTRCQLQVYVFSNECLEQARPSPGLCDDVRHVAEDAEDLAWRQRRCHAAHPENVRECVRYIPVLQGYCARPRGAATGP